VGATYIPIDATWIKPNEKYSAKVNRSRGTDVKYYNVRARVPKDVSANGWAYLTVPDYRIEPSQFSNRDKVSIINYHGSTDFYQSTITVSFKMPDNAPTAFRHGQMSPWRLSNIVRGQDTSREYIVVAHELENVSTPKIRSIDEFAKSPLTVEQQVDQDYTNYKKRINLDIDPIVAHALSKDDLKNEHEGTKIHAAPHFKVGVKDVTKIEDVSIEKPEKSITYTKYGVTESRAPVQLGSEYKTAEQMKKRIHNTAEAAVKEFDKVVDYYVKFNDWAMNNNVPTSIKTVPTPPLRGSSDEDTLSVFKKSIEHWNNRFSDEIASLRDQGYDVPQEFYSIRATVNKDNEYTKMVQFNAMRGVTYFTDNGLTVNSSKNATYMANVAGRYGVSKHEAGLLESGDYVVFAGIPLPSASHKLAHYVGTLAPISAEQRNKLSKNQFDGYEASDLTHYIKLEEIDITDPRFADVERNERYATNKGNYDRQIARVKNNFDVEKPIRNTGASIIREEPKTTHKSPEPTLRIKGDNMFSQDFVTNSFARRKETYLKLRTEPASDFGHQLGFETAWDEKRFFDSFSMLQVLSDGKSITSHKAKLQLLEKSKDGSRDLVGFDKKNTQIYDRFEADWKGMMEQADLRQRLPSPEAVSKGIQNAWEEKVMKNYEAIVGKTYDGGIIPEDDRKVFARYYRLQETLDIRKNGLISKEDVGTSKDKYALLTVSGFYDKASNSGLVYENRSVGNKWEDCKVTDMSIKDVIEEYDDIPDFT